MVWYHNKMIYDKLLIIWEFFCIDNITIIAVVFSIFHKWNPCSFIFSTQRKLDLFLLLQWPGPDKYKCYALVYVWLGRCSLLRWFVIHSRSVLIFRVYLTICVFIPWIHCSCSRNTLHLETSLFLLSLSLQSLLLDWCVLLSTPLYKLM